MLIVWRKIGIRIVFLVIIAMAVISCAEPLSPTATPIPFAPTPAPEPIEFTGGSGRPTPTPFIAQASLGTELFVSKTCSSCHLVDSEDTLVGPGMLNVYQRAGTRSAGYSAEEYLYESVRNPSVFIVDGFDNLMPVFSVSSITDAELQHIFAYLETLN